MPMYSIDELINALESLKRQGYEYAGIEEESADCLKLYSIKTGEGARLVLCLKAGDYYYL